MKIYGDLERAQLETKSSDYATTISGLIWFNSTEGRVKLDDGTIIRALLRNDDKLVVGNSGTASSNVRLLRAGTSKLQFAKGDYATTEGSVGQSSIAEIVQRVENWTDGTKPTAGNAGRLGFNTTTTGLQYDDGATIQDVAGGSSSGSVEALDFVLDKIQQEHSRIIQKPSPVEVHDSFMQAKPTFQCYLLEDYTAAASTLKMVVAPKFVNNSDTLTDSATGWTANGSETITAGAGSGGTAKKIGTAALTYTKASGSVTSFMSRTAPGENVSLNSNLYYWFRSDSGISGTLASLIIRCGSDSSNYRQYSTTTDYVGTTIGTSQQLIKFDLSNTAGSTTTGTGWTTATALTYFAVGVTTDASGDTPSLFFDAIFLADSTGNFVALGDELTIYDASNRDTFIVDAASTTYNGLITLAASMANSYSAIAATVIKRTLITTNADGFGSMVNGLSGNIAKTQEIRIRRILPEVHTSKNFKAVTSFFTSEYFYVKTVNANVSIVVTTNSDISANWLSGRVVDVCQRFGNSYGDYDYVSRGTTYTMTGNATFSTPDMTLPMTNTSGIVVGDLILKKQHTPYISLVSATANESFSAMTRDRIEVVNPGLPYIFPAQVWAHYRLGGFLATTNVFPGGGGSAGLALSQNGTITTSNLFAKSAYSSSGYDTSNNYVLTSGASEPISGDNGDCTNIALSIWFKAPAFTSSHRTLAARAAANLTTGWQLKLDSSANKLSLRVNGTDYGLSSNTFTPNAWNHAFFYYAESDANSALWLNGVNNNVGSHAITDPSQGFYFGNGNGNEGLGANGFLADAVIWKNLTAVPTDAQVNLIYNNGNPLPFGLLAGIDIRSSALALTGQKLSFKVIEDRAADTDTPTLYGVGATKN